MAKVVKFPNFFPKGYIWISTDKTNPSKWFGGTWTPFGQGRVLVGIDSNQSEFNAVNKTGGHKSLQQHYHTGTVDNGGGHNHLLLLNGDPNFPLVGYPGWNGGTTQHAMNLKTSYNGFKSYTDWHGGHQHTFTTSNSGTGNAQNLQPYIVVYMFQRTA